MAQICHLIKWYRYIVHVGTQKKDTKFPFIRSLSLVPEQNPLNILCDGPELLPFISEIYVDVKAKSKEKYIWYVGAEI